MMTKAEIINDIAKRKVVEDIIAHIGKGTYPYVDDLAQDLYLELIEKEENKIQNLYEKKQLNFFITRMVMNNLLSKNSRYYYNYIRWDEKKTELKINADKEDNYYDED